MRVVNNGFAREPACPGTIPSDTNPTEQSRRGNEREGKDPTEPDSCTCCSCKQLEVLEESLWVRNR